MPSVSSDEFDDDDDENLMIFPLTDLDGDDNNNGKNVNNGDGQRCDSIHERAIRSQSRQFPLKLNINQHQYQSGCSSSPKINWMQAIRKIKHLKDPWEKFNIADIPSETATRHRYHPLKKQWVTDKVEIKMEKEVT